MNAARESERGLTLTEVTVTIVLAAVVLTGMIVFYLNSQATWIDGSSQAISQREVSLVLNEITSRAHGAAAATVTGPAPTATLTLSLGTTGLRAWRIWWEPSDSLLHKSYIDSLGVEHAFGPMLQSPVEYFVVHKDNDMVYVDSLRVLTPQGERITMGTSAAMLNRGAP